jgi:hypothetical protein
MEPSVLFVHLHHLDFWLTFTNMGNVCGGNRVNVHPYAHPQQLKVLKHLILVCHGCVMQFERFYSLNCCEVVWLAHLHHLDFWLTLPNMGKCL